MGTGLHGKSSVPSAQFCHEPTTAKKIKFINLKKYLEGIHKTVNSGSLKEEE